MLPDSKHVGVDVGDCDVNIRVAVNIVGMVQYAEGNITGAAGDIENSLGSTERRCCSWVEGGDEVIPV